MTEIGKTAMETRPSVYILGAGMAGLAAAVRADKLGLRPHLFEATSHAGGRCRSFFEPGLDRTIDNGAHLLLGGNTGLFTYLSEVGAQDSLKPMDPVQFPFLDVASGLRWNLQPSAGRLPWWLLVPGRRVPGGRLSDYLAMARLARLDPNATDSPLTDFLDRSAPMFARFWQPLARAVLNTEAEDASAALIGRMLGETFLKGAEASRPYLAPAGLSQALVDPGVTHLAAIGQPPSFAARIKALIFDGTCVSGIETDSGTVAIADGAVISALPPGEAQRLIPGLEAPDQFNAIVNVHYRLEQADNAHRFLGLIGSAAHWVFTKGDVVSVTVSAAGTLADEPAERIASRIWADVAAPLGQKVEQIPAFHVIKEKRATMAQTPAQNAHRPGPKPGFDNLFLAGDWTKTGLPATIEGAVRSGQEAALLAAECTARRAI